MKETPYISAEQSLPEITLRVIVLAVILTALLAMSNAYLALKIGLLTSAAIPAAVISMGILRFFKNTNILENNQVQTAASAGEAVAGGIVYTVPALIIINYWTQFNYWENFFIALIGGVLGVIFSVPIRKTLVREKSLPFPEGRAIAELLKTSVEKASAVRQMVWGLFTGAVIELLQLGLKVVAHSWQKWLMVQNTFVGGGIGFSATMIGAGYLIGFRVAASIMIGALVSWYVGVPVIGLMKDPVMCMDINSAVSQLWGEHNRYIGIGAMLAAGVWTLLQLLRPFFASIRRTLQKQDKAHTGAPLRTEYDIPTAYLIVTLIFSLVLLYVFLHFSPPVAHLDFSGFGQTALVIGILLYILLVGFLASVITGYFSGMVGVSASPGSSVVIASVLFASLLLFFAIRTFSPMEISTEYLQHAAAVALIICAVITGAASIANDNIQDLKVGYILGATPWKQQLMLLLGVVVASLVIPLIMQLLFNVYGIAGVMPRPGMDAAQSLPAPPAAMMAAVTQSVFQQHLPWGMLSLGVMIIVGFVIINRLFLRHMGHELSILGIAIGMYLPLASSTPLFFGGVMALLTTRYLKQQHLVQAEYQARWRRSIIFACGLVAGAALMDVALALPFAVLGSPDALSIVGPGWAPYAALLGVASVIMLAYILFRLVREEAA